MNNSMLSAKSFFRLPVIFFLLATGVMLCSCAPADSVESDTTTTTNTAPETAETTTSADASSTLPPDLDYTPTPSDLRSPEEMTLPSPSSMFDFKPSTELPEGVHSIEFTDKNDFSSYSSDNVLIIRNVPYDNKDGEELTLQILLPKEETGGKLPLIMYIPGSAWMRQNVNIALPQMTKVSEKGFAVAVVEYRGYDVSPFPATVEDIKTAIRFMRMNAEDYNIDTEDISVWGDSSGGHTALFAGVTGEGQFDNGTYGEYSTDVKCVVDWYGPADLPTMAYYPSMLDHNSASSPEGQLIGGKIISENPELAIEASPTHYITAENNIPPILIMHGSADNIVPFNQSVRLYEKLREFNKDVTMYKIEGAGHGTDGWTSDESLDMVIEFIRTASR